VSEKLPAIDSQRLLRALKRAGFEELHQRGSHLTLHRLSDKRRVTIPMHKGRNVAPGTLRAILRDADISVADRHRLL